MRPSQSPFRADAELKVRPYDRAASGLVAALVVVATLVTMMLAVWFTSVLHWEQHRVRVDWDFGGDQGDVESEADDAAPLEAFEFEPDVNITLQAVTDVLSRQAAVATLHISPIDGLSEGNRDGRKPGPRPSGLRPDQQSVRPPWERWEIQFTTNSLDEYRKQLDYFGVELAAFGGNGTIDYASGFVGTPPARRTSTDPKAEKRIRFSWRDGTLLQYDQTLLRQAGIRTAGRVACQFYTTEMIQELRRLEADSGRPPEEWLRTLFSVRPREGGGYEFYVVTQSFLPSSNPQ